MSDWSSKQIAAYRDLLDRSQTLSWKELASLCIANATFQEGLSSESIEEAESVLGRTLPQELSSLYRETGAIYDGTGANLVSPLQDVIDDNLDLWGKGYEDLYMSLTSLFAFGGPGNGDRFFVPITPDGNYHRGIYLWDHENDSRIWQANGIKDLLIRCHVNLIQ